MIRMAATVVVGVAINFHDESHWLLFRKIFAAGVCFLLLGSGLISPVVAKGSVTAEERNSCLSGSGQTAIRLCTDVLTKDPGDIAVRLDLASKMIKLRQYPDAKDILERGRELSPGDQNLQDQLTRVEQLLNEQRWIDEKKQERNVSSKAGNSNKLRLAASRYEIRCTKLKGKTALEACNEGLAKFPENASLYRGKGDALMELSLYGKALKAYKKAQVYNPGDKISKSGIVKAKSLVRVNLKKCLQLEGEVALEACRSAMIKGGKNELAIRQRMGHLYQESGQLTKAISAYQKALVLDKSNATVLAELQSLGVKTTKEQITTSPIKEVVVKTAPKPEPLIAKPLQLIKPIQQKSIAKAPVKTEMPPVQIVVTAKDSVPEMDAVSEKISRVQAVLLKEPEPPKPDDEKQAKYSNAPLPSGFTY